jgi:hypothetical protein
MGKLALVLSVLALSGAGWAVWSSCERARPDEDRDALGALDARLATIERTLAELAARPAPVAPLPGSAPSASSTGLATGGGSPTLGPLLQGSPKAQATMEERVAQLEKQLAAQAEGSAGAARLLGGEAQVFSPPGFWPDAAAAAKALKLDSVQASRLEGIVDATQRELDELFAKPNEEGVLWKDVNQGLTLEAGETGDLLGKLGEHMKKVAKFRSSKVPGTNETYKEAEERIRKDGKERARSLLDRDQARVWDRSHPDSLWQGGAGGDGSISLMTTNGDALELPVPAGR